jgi:uncharacterized protein (DUF302 family)
VSDSLLSVKHVRVTTKKPFARARTDFEAQLGRFDPHAYHSLATGASTEEVRKHLEGMIGPSGFTLFATHDHGSLLRLVGRPRKAIQYIVGNPLYAIQMTQHAIGASLYAPLRVLLYENDAGETCVEYDRPTSLFGQFGNESVDKVAASLDQKLEKLTATALSEK